MRSFSIFTDRYPTHSIQFLRSTKSNQAMFFACLLQYVKCSFWSCGVSGRERFSVGVDLEYLFFFEA